MRGLAERLTTPARPGRLLRRKLVVSVQLLLVVQVLAFSVSTIGWRHDFHPWLDGWLQASEYVTCALLALLRPVVSKVDRGLWALVAAGMAMRALDFVLFLSVIRRLDPIPYPSVSDVGWPAMPGASADG